MDKKKDIKKSTFGKLPFILGIVFSIIFYVINNYQRNSNNNDIHQQQQQQQKQVPSLFDYSFESIDGKLVNFQELKGKKAYLIVNVANQCGLTKKNYLELVEIYQKYSSQGLEVLAFPCNQFKGQEPAENDQIIPIIQKKLDISVNWPVFKKSDVNGSETNPIYKFLKENSSLNVDGKIQNISWNFGKFLVNEKGQVVKYYTPKTSPNQILPDILKLIE